MCRRRCCRTHDRLGRYPGLTVRGFIADLDRLIEYRGPMTPAPIATVAVTERYARRKLRVGKGKLAYRGIPLRCIGSKLWRERNAG
jgi:hypothetical protein